MKKILPFVRSFALVFVLHLAVSLLFDFLFHDYENIGSVICTSLLFDVIYHILNPFRETWNEDKDN